MESDTGHSSTYVTLTSKGGNLPTCFSTELPAQLQLTHDCRVGLKQFIYNTDWNNLDDNSRRFSIDHYENWSSIYAAKKQYQLYDQFWNEMIQAEPKGFWIQTKCDATSKRTRSRIFPEDIKKKEVGYETLLKIVLEHIETNVKKVLEPLIEKHAIVVRTFIDYLQEPQSVHIIILWKDVDTSIKNKLGYPVTVTFRFSRKLRSFGFSKVHLQLMSPMNSRKFDISAWKNQWVGRYEHVTSHAIRAQYWGQTPTQFDIKFTSSDQQDNNNVTPLVLPLEKMSNIESFLFWLAHHLSQKIRRFLGWIALLGIDLSTQISDNTMELSCIGTDCSISWTWPQYFITEFGFPSNMISLTPSTPVKVIVSKLPNALIPPSFVIPRKMKTTCVMPDRPYISPHDLIDGFNTAVLQSDLPRDIKETLNISVVTDKQHAKLSFSPSTFDCKQWWRITLPAQLAALFGFAKDSDIQPTIFGSSDISFNEYGILEGINVIPIPKWSTISFFKINTHRRLDTVLVCCNLVPNTVVADGRARLIRAIPLVHSNLYDKEIVVDFEEPWFMKLQQIKIDEITIDIRTHDNNDSVKFWKPVTLVLEFRSGFAI